MHTPFCVMLVGNMPTIVLPSRGAIVQVASGAGVATGVVIPQGGALCVLAPNADVVINIPILGGGAYIVTVQRGMMRIIPPSDIQTQAVLGTSTDAYELYIENLAAYSAPSAFT